MPTTGTLYLKETMRSRPRLIINTTTTTIIINKISWGRLARLQNVGGRRLGLRDKAHGSDRYESESDGGNCPARRSAKSGALRCGNCAKFNKDFATGHLSSSTYPATTLQGFAPFYGLRPTPARDQLSGSGVARAANMHCRPVVRVRPSAFAPLPAQESEDARGGRALAQRLRGVAKCGACLPSGSSEEQSASVSSEGGDFWERKQSSVLSSAF